MKKFESLSSLESRKNFPTITNAKASPKEKPKSKESCKDTEKRCCKKSFSEDFLSKSEIEELKSSSSSRIPLLLSSDGRKVTETIIIKETGEKIESSGNKGVIRKRKDSEKQKTTRSRLSAAFRSFRFSSKSDSSKKVRISNSERDLNRIEEFSPRKDKLKVERLRNFSAEDPHRSIEEDSDKEDISKRTSSAINFCKEKNKKLKKLERKKSSEEADLSPENQTKKLKKKRLSLTKRFSLLRKNKKSDSIKKSEELTRNLPQSISSSGGDLVNIGTQTPSSISNLLIHRQTPEGGNLSISQLSLISVQSSTAEVEETPESEEKILRETATEGDTILSPVEFERVQKIHITIEGKGAAPRSFQSKKNQLTITTASPSSEEYFSALSEPSLSSSSVTQAPSKSSSVSPEAPIIAKITSSLTSSEIPSSSPPPPPPPSSVSVQSSSPSQSQSIVDRTKALKKPSTLKQQKTLTPTGEKSYPEQGILKKKSSKTAISSNTTIGGSSTVGSSKKINITESTRDTPPRERAPSRPDPSSAASNQDKRSNLTDSKIGKGLNSFDKNNNKNSNSSAVAGGGGGSGAIRKSPSNVSLSKLKGQKLQEIENSGQFMQQTGDNKSKISGSAVSGAGGNIVRTTSISSSISSSTPIVAVPTAERGRRFPRPPTTSQITVIENRPPSPLPPPPPTPPKSENSPVLTRRRSSVQIQEPQTFYSENTHSAVKSSSPAGRTLISAGNNVRNPNLSGSIGDKSSYESAAEDDIPTPTNTVQKKSVTVIETRPRIQFSLGNDKRTKNQTQRNELKKQERQIGKEDNKQQQQQKQQEEIKSQKQPQKTRFADLQISSDREVGSIGSGSESQSPVSEGALAAARRRIRYIEQPTLYTDEEREILAGNRSYVSSEYSFDSDFSTETQMPAYGDLTMEEAPIMTSSTSEKREHLYKILVIGELGTGKTSFIKRYVHQFFSQNYRATIGVDFALKVIPWDPNTVVRLQLWDIAGQERFGNMTRVYYKEAVGAFIVFDVTRSGTFDCVSKWKEDLDSKVQLPDGKPIPCILLANKCDQEKQGIATEPSKMSEYCEENGFVGWFETSAKENINIDEAATALIDAILRNDKLINAADIDDNDKIALNRTNNASSSSHSKKMCSC